MTPFSQTLRALEADAKSRRLAVAGALVGAVLLGCWLGWFFFSKVTLSAVTALARLEASIEPHPVVAEVPGRISRSRVTVGAEVEAGEVLVELETESLDLEIAEVQARRDSLVARIEASRQELEASRAGLQQARIAASATKDAAAARATAAAVQATFAEGEVPTLAKLRDDGSVADIDVERAKAAAASLRATAAAESKEAARAEWEAGRGLSDRAASIEARHSALVALEGALAESEVTIDRLELRLEHHVIRAPTSGRLGEVDAPRPGALLNAGERIAVVVPVGELKLIADFPPEVAVGRIHPGQSASMRLHGFPWLQYGALPAKVTAVASELRSGLLRVELSVSDPEASRAPLSHGLPGDVSIELERVSPAALTLRVAGRMAGSMQRTVNATE